MCNKTDNPLLSSTIYPKIIRRISSVGERFVEEAMKKWAMKLSHISSELKQNHPSPIPFPILLLGLLKRTLYECIEWLRECRLRVYRNCYKSDESTSHHHVRISSRHGLEWLGQLVLFLVLNHGQTHSMGWHYSQQCHSSMESQLWLNSACAPCEKGLRQGEWWERVQIK